MSIDANHNAAVDHFSLTGHFLIAMPALSDPNFERSVIFLCEHSPKGAMGLIINKPTDIELHSLFERIDLDVHQGGLPLNQRVFQGGPVSNERGFVLHSVPHGLPMDQSDYNSSLRITPNLAMTTSRDILEAVAKGHAPDQWLIALGYAGWSEGQLEQELAANAWLNVPADLSIVFDCPIEQRFDQAMGLLGIDPRLLHGTAGHA